MLTEPDVGPLDPPVPSRTGRDPGNLHGDYDEVDVELAARQWPTWWTRALQQVPATMWQEVQEAAPPGPPQWRGLQDLPALQTLAERHHHDFWRWLDVPKQAEQEQVQGRRGSSDGLHSTHFVNAYESRLGRPVRPFVLHLRLLPLAQPVGWVLDEQQVLLSTRLRGDRAASEALLAPVFAALA